MFICPKNTFLSSNIPKIMAPVRQAHLIIGGDLIFALLAPIFVSLILLGCYGLHFALRKLATWSLKATQFPNVAQVRLEGPWAFRKPGQGSYPRFISKVRILVVTMTLRHLNANGAIVAQASIAGGLELNSMTGCFALCSIRWQDVVTLNRPLLKKPLTSWLSD